MLAHLNRIGSVGLSIGFFLLCPMERIIMVDKMKQLRQMNIFVGVLYQLVHHVHRTFFQKNSKLQYILL